MQFWKDYNICDCIMNLAWAWGDVSRECANGIWKNTLNRLGNDCRVFAKFARISKAAIEMASNLTWVWMSVTLRSS